MVGNGLSERALLGVVACGALVGGNCYVLLLMRRLYCGDGRSGFFSRVKVSRRMEYSYCC